METQRLPVPDIRDDSVFQHSYKRASRREDSSRLRPPKLNPRYCHYSDSTFNRSHSTTAHAISFRGEGEEAALPLSASYDRSTSETYFEQCFVRIAKIGEGSFGEVFKVRSKEDGLLYAVKMSKQLFRSENYRQERLEEVRLYEQFSGHANCVRFYRAWEQDDRLYMQMELCRESLEYYLERHRHIAEEKIWSIMLDLLLALKSLHDRNLIHLDIKLDNVLIGDDECCKLADFGLVIDVDRANRHEATEGDSRYMAPEIMQGKFSKAADIFSLGIAILELSCYLELPSNGPLWQELRSGILPDNFIKPISAELQNIIKQMMTPEPEARPTVDQLLTHKRFIRMIQYRNRWEIIHKLMQTIRSSCRVAWSKMCNFKNVVVTFITCWFGAALKKESNVSNGKGPNVCAQLISSTPRTGDSKTQPCDDFTMDENCFDLSQQGTPWRGVNHFANGKVVNSTPVNHNHNSFRSRKDLTKTSFKIIGSDESGYGDKQSFLNLDDTATDYFTKIHNSSLRKILFPKAEDSD